MTLMFFVTIITATADKADRWCSPPSGEGERLVVFWHKKGDLWVIRGSGKLHCVRFISDGLGSENGGGALSPEASAKAIPYGTEAVD